jgi:alpha-ribazole phosphatase
MDALTLWRHPMPRGIEGLCVGQLDVPVDRRKSKRLAHRIRAWTRRHRAPRVVLTSPLSRSADVGRWLSRWGWRHEIDARLLELDFGAWQGRAWQAIGREQIDAWCGDFAAHRPGGGESTAALLARCSSFLADARNASAVCVVGHAGWISAAIWLQQASDRPLDASSWPAAVRYGVMVELKR